MGALFEAAGYKAVPSPRQPSPGNDLYYRGGYTAQVHGSRDGGVVDAIQLEFPGEIRTDGGKALRQQFSLALAKIIENFYQTNYQHALDYVHYTPGDINLIFTAPHNGHMKPSSMPTRQPGCQNNKGVCEFPGKKSCSKSKICKVAILGDAQTKDITRMVFDAFVENTGKTPHLIINNVHRSKMDPNRVIEDAAQGDDESIEAFNTYHNTIVQAKKSFHGKPGLLIDFHGQGHGKNCTEIGYLIKKAALNSRNYAKSELSISSLVRRKNAKLNDFIFGKKSMGALFEAAGYKAVPSPRQPSPGNDLYYRGGYTAQVHGSRDGGVVDAIQLEFPGEIRTDGGKELRDIFSRKVAKIIEDYYHLNYHFSIEYVDYIQGNMNLIFSVPHNGHMKPDYMPMRQPGCENEKGVCEFPGKKSCSKSKECKVATKGDAQSQDIARTVFKAFVKNTGKTPHLIINNVHRSKMDPNRVIADAAQGDEEAIEAFNTYHGTIKEAKKSFGGKPGLLIDFHGQGHGKNSTEIGYLIKKAALNAKHFANSELSIKSLVSRKNAKLSDFLFGKKSMGALFEAAGYKAVDILHRYMDLEMG